MPTLKLASRNQQDGPSTTSRLAVGTHPSQSRLLSQELFLQELSSEQRRSERSGRAFLLVLISGEDLLKNSGGEPVRTATAAISSCIRETDVFGWYEQSSTLGLLMTEVLDPSTAVIESIVGKISMALQNAVRAEVYCRLAMVVRVFPDEVEDRVFCVDMSSRNVTSWIDHGLKRMIDILGSLAALIVLSPVFLLIALCVKCTSPGPVFFRKKRLGQHGKEFSFYKFRTMYANNDPDLHREYVCKLIAGSAGAKQRDGFYKLTNDPRITSLGRFLRRTSLDELPQFFNVLLNDMSLVGPRPPLAYEYEKYSTWHKRRVLELKPGMTGLWQVEGRSRTTFDEMVRMDIRYARVRNLWLDLKIMIQTPAAMITGRGAC
jgi:lipopolysaccharide/colanic/teichoic acid biosynthesis glycosyltransferase